MLFASATHARSTTSVDSSFILSVDTALSPDSIYHVTSYRLIGVTTKFNKRWRKLGNLRYGEIIRPTYADIRKMLLPVSVFKRAKLVKVVIDKDVRQIGTFVALTFYYARRKD